MFKAFIWRFTRKGWIRSEVLILLLMCFIIYLSTSKDKVNLKVSKEYKSRESKSKESKSHCNISNMDPIFEKMVAKYAKNNTILLSITDYVYVELAENLYESSFKKFGIDNYLFVCNHEKAEEYLTTRGIHAITLWNKTDSFIGSSYGLKAYKKKTHLKTYPVYMSLCLGYITMLVDVDIVFIRNPMRYMMRHASSQDMIIQNEFGQVNSGFYLATTRGRAVELHERLLPTDAETNDREYESQQPHLNRIIANKEIPGICVEKLPYKLFPWGGYFFLHTRREFHGDHPMAVEPYIIHMTRSSGLGEKRYRLREFLLWHVDTDRYYSSPDRKYVTFELPVDLFDKDRQRRALIGAFVLANQINRTLILPAFHCAGYNTREHHCNYLSISGRYALNRFEGLYREHMFLSSPLVPDSVKKSQVDIDLTDALTYRVLDENKMAEVKDVLRRCERYSVIRLKNLHNFTIMEGTPEWRRFKVV